MAKTYFAKLQSQNFEMQTDDFNKFLDCAFEAFLKNISFLVSDDRYNVEEFGVSKTEVKCNAYMLLTANPNVYNYYKNVLLPSLPLECHLPSMEKVVFRAGIVDDRL